MQRHLTSNSILRGVGDVSECKTLSAAVICQDHPLLWPILFTKYTATKAKVLNIFDQRTPANHNLFGNDSDSRVAEATVLLLHLRCMSLMHAQADL